MEAFSVVFLMVVAGLAIAAVYSLNQRKRANEAWREAAGRRNLLFRPSDLFTQPQLTGTLEGHQLSVTVVTRGADTAQKYTRYRLEYREPLPAGLRISREHTGFLASVRQAVAREDIRVGDPEFDDRFRVRGSDAVLVRAFLTLPRRLMLLTVSDLFPGMQIDDRQLTYDVKDVELNPELIVNTVDKLIETASGLSSAPLESGRHGGVRNEVVIHSPVVEGTSPGRYIRLPAAEAGGPELGLPIPLAGPQEHDHRARPEAPAPASPEDHDEAALLAGAAERTASDLESAPDDTPTVAAVSAAVFDKSVARADAPQAFTDRYRGRHVRWFGSLASVARYPFDRVFGREPGCRAVFAVHRMERSFGSGDVRAILQLPDGEEIGLRTRVGRTLEFEGRLIEYDQFMQTLFIADGRILSSLAANEPS